MGLIRETNKRAGLTIIELLIAVSVSVVVSGSIIGMLYFFSHTLGSITRDMVNVREIERASDKVYFDMIRTSKKDPLNTIYKPLEIKSDTEIWYQLLTPDPVTGQVFSPEDGESYWGDGNVMGRWIRLWLDGDGNLVREIWSGQPESSVRLSKEVLVRDATFFVQGLDTTGKYEKNFLPRVIHFEIGSNKTDFKKVFQVKLRGP